MDKFATQQQITYEQLYFEDRHSIVLRFTPGSLQNPVVQEITPKDYEKRLNISLRFHWQEI